MLVHPCPACDDNTPRLLEYNTQVSAVDYYRCDACKHVWTTDRATGQVVTHVTPLLEPKAPTKK